MSEMSEKIGSILVSLGSVEEKNITRILEVSKEEGIRFGEACIRLSLIDEVKLRDALAKQYGLEVIDISKHEVDSKALDSIPSLLLSSASVVPLNVDGSTVLAVADPTDILAIDDVTNQLARKGIKVTATYCATAKSVETVLSKGEGAERVLKEAEESFSLEDLKVSDEDGEDFLTLEKITESSSPVVKLVDTAIYDAIVKKASDIHMESTEEGLYIKYRLDGVLYKGMGPIDKNFQASIISRIKVMSDLDISERRVPQDGKFKIKFKHKAIDFRVSIMPSIHGEDAVIRILDKENITQEFNELSLDILGFGEGQLQHLRRMIKEPYGMVLVTGPTGSGKTTTLYAALSEVNSGRDKIITIEDPVEYELKGVVQIPVNEKKGLTFARGLRSVLRHDPDKIMVGEIRDSETAEIAIQAALTGHLVFTTVHANNVFDVIGRFVHMGIEPYNFVSSLNGVMAQRLIRLLCPKCKKENDYSDSELEESGLDPSKFKGTTFYSPVGCESCFDTGYKGRLAIVELLDLNDTIRDLISAKEPMSVIKKQAYSDGLIGLREIAVGKVVDGVTSLEEINRVTFVS